MSEVANALAVSSSSLRRYLSKECNDTFSHYLISLRMDYAATCLCSSGQSINEIAYESGFRDALYFRRVFKKWYGLTPSEYRDKHKVSDLQADR